MAISATELDAMSALLADAGMLPPAASQAEVNDTPSDADRMAALDFFAVF